MLLNLKRAYVEAYSKPRSKEILFFTSKVDDFIFRSDEEIVIHLQTVLRTLSPVFTLSKNLIERPFYCGKAEGGIGGIWTLRIPKQLLEPGFYHIEVEADLGFGLCPGGESVLAKGKMLQGGCTFGYDLENWNFGPELPADFDAFWEASKHKLDGIELDVICGEKTIYRGDQIDQYNLAAAGLPMDYDPDGHIYEEVESYEISFMSASGVRIHGWFAKPVTEDICPAMLVLPGAGFHQRPRPLEHARHGYAALDIQVHGQPLSAGEYALTPGRIHCDDARLGKNYYYNDIYLHCIQAINYLCSREDIDKERIITVGGSQGGRLSLTTAALDSRVSAVVAGIAHYANLPYVYWIEDINKRNQDGTEPGFVYSNPELVASTAYYDVANFAHRITCPVMMNGGLIDRMSIPEGVYAIYQRLSSKEKHLIWLPTMGHDWSPEFDRQAFRWLKKL